MLKVLQANNPAQLEEKFNEFAESVVVTQVLTHPKEANWLYVFYIEEQHLPDHIRVLENGRFFDENTKKFVKQDSWKQ